MVWVQGIHRTRKSQLLITTHSDHAGCPLTQQSGLRTCTLPLLAIPMATTTIKPTTACTIPGCMAIAPQTPPLQHSNPTLQQHQGAASAPCHQDPLPCHLSVLCMRSQAQREPGMPHSPLQAPGSSPSSRCPPCSSTASCHCTSACKRSRQQLQQLQDHQRARGQGLQMQAQMMTTPWAWDTSPEVSPSCATPPCKHSLARSNVS